MVKGVTIGQYVHGSSPLHKSDPRAKLILSLLFIILLFAVSSPVSYSVITVLVALGVCVSGVKIRLILRGMRPALFIIIFTCIINMFTGSGTPLFTLPLGIFTLKLTYEGIVRALFVSVRLIYLLCFTSLLTLTTPPLMLTQSIESVMSPLRRLHVPVHETALMMSIALRFIPTLADEADKIMKAQTARGADFASGNIIRRARAMLPLLIPLFVSAFRRADELATAMEARCYHGGDGRTRMKQLHFKKSDAVICMVFAFFVLSAVICEIIW